MTGTVVKDILAQRVHAGQSQQAFEYAQHAPEVPTCSASTLVMYLSKLPGVAADVRRACSDWIIEHSASAQDRAHEFYKRGYAVEQAADSGQAVGAEVAETAVSDLIEAERLFQQAATGESMDVLAADLRELAGDAHYARFRIIRGALKDLTRAGECGTSFLDQYPEHRNARAVRGFLAPR